MVRASEFRPGRHVVLASHIATQIVCGPGVIAKLGADNPTARLLAYGEGLPELVRL